jgi:hypothetical protein
MISYGVRKSTALISQNTSGILQVLYPLLPQKRRLQNSLVYTVMFKQSVYYGLRMISRDLFNEGSRTEQALLLVVTVFGFLNIIFSVFAVMEHCVVLYLLLKRNTGICRSCIAKRHKANRPQSLSSANQSLLVIKYQIRPC